MTAGFSCFIPPSPEDAAAFDRLIGEEIAAPPTREGIGRLNEKRMHRILRRFVRDDPSLWETDAGGGYVADIIDGGTLFEIQTGPLLPLKEKIAYYLESTDLQTVVIHPVAAKKYVVWIDPDNGSVSGRHLSPKKEGRGSVLASSVYIAEFFGTGRLTLRLLFIEEEEYRLLNGRRSADRKKGSERFERLPSKLLGELSLSSPADFRKLIPDTLPQRFTAAELGKAGGLRGRDVYRAAKALELLGLAVPCGKRGRSAEWERIIP